VGCWYHPFTALKKGELDTNDVKRWDAPFHRRIVRHGRSQAFNRHVKQMRTAESHSSFRRQNCVHVNDGWIDRRINTWLVIWMGSREERLSTLPIVQEVNLTSIITGRLGWSRLITCTTVTPTDRRMPD